jgi:biotin carboxyl carrier protein
MNVDRVEALLELLERQTHVGELLVEGADWKVQVTRRPRRPSADPPLAQPPSAPQKVTITADRVGLYRPASQPLVRGDHVGRGMVVATIDAMRIQNPVTAGGSGYVHEIRADPGDPVEYGQVLFVLGAEPPEPAEEDEQ